MRQILIAVGIALAVSILLTPALIRLFTRQGLGHEIREDGPPSHHKKRGTPSMGGSSSAWRPRWAPSGSSTT
jgi:phospho-N-acetylmuramoyl-pentapeptide-transferase